MGKALLIIVIAAALGGGVMMYQTQGTERETESQLGKSHAEFLAREASRSGYEVGVGDVARDFTAQPMRERVETANSAQGTYDLAVEPTDDATLRVIATGRAGYRTASGGAGVAEHTLWGEFARVVETPSAVVLDAEEVNPSFSGEHFRISGDDRRPASTASAGTTAEVGLGTDSYAVYATRPGVATTFRSGLSTGQQSGVQGRNDDSEGGAVAQGNELPALVQRIYDDAMARVGAGEADAVSIVGDRVFAGAETFGSTANSPRVVHIDGDVTIRGRVRGHGVLIVNGDLTIESTSSDPADNFAWEGLVIVRHGGEVSFSQTGATRIDGGLVVQAPPAEVDDDPIDFDIDDDGEITVNERFAARVEVLGAAISSGGAYDVPVTLQIGIDGDTYSPWGNSSYPVSSNINDDRNPRSFDLPDVYEAGERIVVEARSFLRRQGKSGRRDSDWYEYLSVRSGGSNNRLVKVLRDGDSVPQISGFMNQTAIAGYVSDYVVGGRVRLDDNQAIYLFELGTTDTRSAAADYQDAVVLVTLSKEEEVVAQHAGSGGGEGEAEPAPTSRVNFAMGGDATIQYSSEALGRLAANLPSARAAASVASVKQRSYDPRQPHEVMPTESALIDADADADIDDDALVTVCLGGTTQTITVGLLKGQAGGATLGPCAESRDKVAVCHRQSNQPHTLEIGAAALPAHLAHGDTMGACPPGESNGGNAGSNGTGGSNGNAGSNGNGGTNGNAGGGADGGDTGSDDGDGTGGWGGWWDWLLN